MSTFVFPGQGSQHKGMGRDLFARYPEILAIADRILGYSMQELCLEDPKGLLSQTQFTQPALFVVNALTYFRSRDSKKNPPQYVAGHSLGEYNALMAAEVFDFETGLRLVQKRGELMSKVRGGGMAAVIGLAETDIARVLSQPAFSNIDIANRNTPSQFVISGPLDEINKVKPALDAAGAKTVVPLRVSAPFHSRHMASMREEFAEFLGTVKLLAPRIPVISNVEGRPYSAERIRELLALQITSSVLWTESIRYLMALGESDFVEVGPGTVLTGLIKKIREEAPPLDLTPEAEAPLDANPEREHPAYRKDGVYVVIGGAGGIGTVWSEYVIRNYRARTVWIGRRKLTSEIQENIERLGKIGPRPIYISADATNRHSLQSAYDEIQRHYSGINGLVHAAIVLQDQSIANMNEEVFRSSLSAKVDVSVRMAQVFGAEPLDFVLFFSSITAFGKRAGQSNYAAGCTFKDAFAQKMAKEWPCVVKVMNWGFWGSVGITASDAHRQRMSQLGVGSIEADEGMRELETLFGNPVSQLAMVKVTKPMNVPGMNLSETLDGSTQTVPSILSLLVERSDRRQTPAGQGLSPALLERRRRVDALLHRLLYVQLRQLGLLNGESAWQIDAGQQAWFEESVDSLCRAGLARREGTKVESLAPNSVTPESVWQEWEGLKDNWGDSEPMAPLNLVETTLRALPEILTGKRRATDVLFPNSSMELVGAIYKNNRVADYFNDVLADGVVAYCEARIEQDPTTKLRILEVGAGTGGTTATVLNRLKPLSRHIAEYCYTDVSKAFLLYGERMYGSANPYMSFKTFNVELDPAAQDLTLDGYDLVIAANVLHATSGIRQTLRHAKSLLHRNGLLLLNELNERSLFSHLTFGLLQGWWLYKDPVLRIKGTPVLAGDTWKRVLSDEGFHAVAFLATPAGDFGQQIVAAESDGRIRRQLGPIGRKPAPEQPVQKHDNSPAHPVSAPAGEVSSLREKAREYFKRAVGSTLKIPPHKIASNEPLERYGVDSINIVELTNALRNDLGEIDSTLFFEFQTIDAVTDHFLASRTDRLARLLGDETPAKRPETARVEKESTSPVPPVMRKTAPNFRGEDSNRTSADIAIVGLAGRYPGADDVAHFWEVLEEGRNCATEIPRDRWPWEKYFDSERGKWGSIYTRWGCFVKDIDKFDPLFFHISPLEARRMDPQERLFLEVAYAGIEDAGYTPARLSKSRKIGVFVGVMNSTYKAQPTHWSIPNRVSYCFDFQGPSIAVDTACSASLTAIHLAVESIRSGSSDCAIAGGVNLIVDPVHYFGLSLPGMLSAADKCRPFADGTDGFVDGEGVGAVVLKPLAQAVADGDRIYGVIKGTAVNSGGKSNGFTVPNPVAQTQLILDALKAAKVHPRSVSYIEAQATGTMLGDPIEIAGLKRAFEKETGDKGFCAIGSVKSNIGHCESAAGIAGLTKVLLQLQHGVLAPSINAESLNPNIRFEDSPFRVQRQLEEWKRPMLALDGTTREYPRIAGISAFGAGGANAHILVEEFDSNAVEDSLSAVNEAPSLILLSARNEEALRRTVVRLHGYLKHSRLRNEPLRLADVAFTLQVGRVAMDERIALIVGSLQELEEKLEHLIQGPLDAEGVFHARVKKNTGAASLFVEDVEMAEAVDKWLQRGKLSKLVEIWLLGVDPDWERLYQSQKPRRVSLPTYPFARERYWLDDSERVVVNAPASPQASVPAPPVPQRQIPAAESIEEHVRSIVAKKLCEALAIADVGIIDFDDSFADFGLDSITGTEVVQRINQALGIELNVSRLFDYASVNQLSAYIAAEHRLELSTAAVSPPRAEIDVHPTKETSPVAASMNRVQSFEKEPIAVVGMSGRFAKSKSLDELWRHLAAGDDLIEQVTRWDLSAHYAAESLDRDNSCVDGGLLEDIDRFDPMFFNIPAVEATYMDPQQRLFLEESWHAMENAGYAGKNTDGLACGVYVGCGNGDYFNLFGKTPPAQGFWGAAGSIIPARIAYYMNLHGPAIAIDTACSSSLVAIHLACQGLWAGETEMALAGGVFVQATPAFYVLATRAGMLSPTGRCHTFDKSADGFVMGEGVGVLVLKRLSQAVADGDHVHGVIRASGINQDGKTNGITAPSSRSQERLEREVYETFHINPSDIGMVEAHGTGTKLGDPIEFEALTRAFRKDTDRHNYCAIGSIKTNLGHATTAAGVAGVIKLLLSLQNKQIPPSLNFAEGNGAIAFDDSPFYVNTQLKEWSVSPGRKRLAAVSSFGFSGTNAHMVLEEAPAAARTHVKRPAYLVVLSARTAEQLRQQADQLHEYCRLHLDLDCGNVSFTLVVGRKHLNHRLAAIVSDVGELSTELDKWLASAKSSGIQVSDLNQKNRPETVSLKRYGNECIAKANNTGDRNAALEQLSAIAELYLLGYPLDYENLFANGGYSRIPLPTYPFARERYWIPAAEGIHPSEALVHREKTTVLSSPRLNPVSRKPASPVADEGLVGAVTLLPVWDPVVPDRGPRSTPISADNVVIIGDGDARQRDIKSQFPNAISFSLDRSQSTDDLRTLLESAGSIGHLCWIVPRRATVSPLEDAIIEQQDEAVLASFRLIKAMLALGYGNRPLHWTVITNQSQPILGGLESSASHAGIHGLVGTMAHEYPHWRVRLVDLEEAAASSLGEVFQLPEDTQGAWARRGPQWYRRRLLPCRNLPEEGRAYRNSGVYVIIGGAGGIGEICSEYLIRRHQAHVVWIGRRPQDAAITRKLERLSQLGEAPIYISADASDFDDLTRAYEEIRQHYPAIHGVVHSAVGAFDRSLAEMDESLFSEGLAAKVDASVRMAQVFQNERLDFVVFFSSMESIATSHGKASYSAGCTFMDAYAAQLSRLWPCKVRVMNWGYWREIGVAKAMPETAKNRLARSGVASIEAEEGMKALAALISGPFDQVLFFKTDKPISTDLLGTTDFMDGANRRKSTAAVESQSVEIQQAHTTTVPGEDSTAARLQKIISNITQVATENLSMQLTWTELGLDSILSMQVLQEIESQFGLRLYPNELIELDTLEKLSSFLSSEIADKTTPDEGSLVSALKPVVFILSTPRAGSTLLRVMLAGHRQLFSPPELHLLPFSDLAERTALLKANNQQFLEEGLIKALCELKGIGVEEAKAVAAGWAAENLPIKDVYRELQTLCPDKHLVDKSPTYANDLSTLLRAESLATAPFFVHLVRHPLSVMESFVRNRFDKLLAIKEDPWVFAAKLWHRYNQNIESFLSGLPHDRWIRIRYEDLVTQPQQITRELCTRLGLEFDSRVLNPYEGERMTQGLHKVSMPVADPNFNSHTQIEPELGAIWAEYLHKTPILSKDAIGLATSYGYRFEKDAIHKLLPAQENFLNRFGDSPVWHIVQRTRVKLDHPLDYGRLSDCLHHAVAKHASLRSSFVREGARWSQAEGDTYAVPLLRLDAANLDQSQFEEAFDILKRDLNGSVNCDARVNLSCGVVDFGKGEYDIVLVAHHLVADGISMLLLQKEIVQNYRRSGVVALVPQPDSRMYAYLDEIDRRLTSTVLAQHKEFWQSHIDSPRFCLPFDIEKDNRRNDVASEVEYAVEVPMNAMSWASGRPWNQFFVHLAGALYRCLGEWTGQSEIAIAHRVHRRTIAADTDFSGVLGWFAGDVPVKVTVGTHVILSQMAAAFSQQFAAIPMGGVSYEVLANAGQIAHSHEVCPIRLNYHPGHLASDDLEMELQKFEAPSHARLYDLDLIVSTRGDNCVFLVRYSRDYFSAAAITEFVNRWVAACHVDEEIVLGRSADQGGLA